MVCAYFYLKCYKKPCIAADGKPLKKIQYGHNISCPIIKRLSLTLQEEHANIWKLKSEAVKSQDFEVASEARNLENKLMEMQKVLRVTV